MSFASAQSRAALGPAYRLLWRLTPQTPRTIRCAEIPRIAIRRNRVPRGGTQRGSAWRVDLTPRQQLRELLEGHLVVSIVVGNLAGTCFGNGNRTRACHPNLVPFLPGKGQHQRDQQLRQTSFKRNPTTLNAHLDQETRCPKGLVQPTTAGRKCTDKQVSIAMLWCAFRGESGTKSLPLRTPCHSHPW